MSIFDLIFIVAFLTSVVTLAVAAIAFVRGRRATALNILRIYGICAVGYFVCDAAVAFLRPQRLIAIGTPWCFDEWCLTVAGVKHTTAARMNAYHVDLLLSSQARGRAQRANGAWIYLIDDQGNRYAPEPDSSDIPLNVLIQPGQSIDASRRFKVPADIHQVGLVTGHGGPYCGAMAILIIGSGGCLFNKPTMIRIQ